MTQEQEIAAIQTAELLGAFTGYVFSGGDPDNISSAATIAQSGLVNNYLNHDERSEVEDLVAERNVICAGSGGGAGPSCSQTNERVIEIDARLVELKKVSTLRTQHLINTCAQGPSNLCSAMLLEAEAFNAWTRESWNYDYRDGFSTGGDLVFEGGDFGSLFDLDDAIVEIYGKVRTEADAEQAAIEIVAQIAKFDGRIKVVAGAIEIAGITVCTAGSGGACALAVVGAVVGANTAVEGVLQISGGEDQISPAEAALIAGGVEGTTAEQIVDWVETGVAVVTVVGGVKIVTSAAGKLIGKVGTNGRPPVTNPTAQQVEAANDLGVDARWVRADGSPDWPPNNGFAGTPEVVNLQPGARIDRYGSNDGGFLSPAGTPFEQRALPNSSANSQFQTFEVVRPLPVNSGQAAPWFGQPGGGTQYQLQGVNVQQLLDEGYLRVVN